MAVQRLVLLVCVVSLSAEPKVNVEVRRPGSPEFDFKEIRRPARNDYGSSAKVQILAGEPDANSGEVTVLTDGKAPLEEDAPRANFFFRPGTESGKILFDFGSAATIREINSYSWHPDSRAAQRYVVYGGTEAAVDGDDGGPGRNWTKIAAVDTQQSSGEGGQHGVSISAQTGALGSYRYWLFIIEPGSPGETFGQTFFSEIDLIGDEQVAELEVAEPKAGQTNLEIEQGKYRVVIDASEAPELIEWIERELKPVISEWYPKIVRLLPSEGYTPPDHITISFHANMRGVANASGTRIRASAEWIKNNLEGEAKGSIVHELVHVVQQYRSRRGDRASTRTPGWIVEGIPDYIRWFLYEPESRGAEISARGIERARYDANYRISANFIHWVATNYYGDVLRELNAAAREGRYTDEIWKDLTGKSVTELGDEWKSTLERRIANGKKDGKEL